MCDKAFKRSDALKEHSETHTGEKAYQCTTCDKSFRRSSSLKTHKLTHTGEKPYKCKTCMKYFNRSDLLKGHEKLHIDGKFQCSICSISNQNLRRHEASQHTELKTSFKCDLCDKSFALEVLLYSHKTRIHT